MMEFLLLNWTTRKERSYEIDGFIWCTSFSLFDFFPALFRLALFGEIFFWTPTVTWMAFPGRFILIDGSFGLEFANQIDI